MQRLLVLCMVLILTVFSSSAVHAAVLTVGPDGWQAYDTIQAAVDDAIDGDVIKVFQGTYPEQVEIRGIDDLLVDGEQATITVPESGMVGHVNESPPRTEALTQCLSRQMLDDGFRIGRFRL